MAVYWDVYRDIHMYIYISYVQYIYICIHTTDYSQEVNWITPVFCYGHQSIKRDLHSRYLWIPIMRWMTMTHKPCADRGTPGNDEVWTCCQTSGNQNL